MEELDRKEDKVMGWLDSDLPNKQKRHIGLGRMIDYRDEKDLCEQLTAVIRKHENVCEVLKGMESAYEMLKAYSARLNDTLKAIESDKRTFKLDLETGNEVFVKAHFFRASPETGYQFFEHPSPGKLTAHFAYKSVACVIEVQETV